MSPPSIVELQRDVAAMTPGEWQVAGPWPAVSIVIDLDPNSGPPIEIAAMGTLVGKSRDARRRVLAALSKGRP